MNISKTFLSIVLSCLLIITWNSSTEIPKHIPLYSIPINKQEVKSFEVKKTSNPTETIWSSMSREFELDHQLHSSRVQKEIRRMLADQPHFYKILQAALPYIHYIHNQTKAKGLPAEIALIPFIESEFNPNDRSNKGALGLWQLMAGTARDLGVKIKTGYDGRRNVITSTKAALAYFNDLGKLFKGNWYLAIAAYNCGEGRVKSSIRRTGHQNFWNLPLPQETKYYVPRLLAVAAIIKNPARYGVKLPPIQNKTYFTQVTVKKPLTLTNIGKYTGIKPEVLHSLNPDYAPKKIPSSTPSTTFLIPVEHEPVIKTQLQNHKVLDVK